MDLKSRFFLIRKHLLDKRNILLILAMTIIMLILLFCVTVYFIFAHNPSKNIAYHTIEVTKKQNNPENDYSVLNNIEHVIYKTSTPNGIIYLNPTIFKSEHQQSEMTLKILFTSDLLKVTKGTSNLKDYEMICPSNFYPYDINSEANVLDKIYPKNFFNMNKSIGKTFNIDINNQNISLKLVGTYDNYRYYESFNTCFISESTYNKLDIPKKDSYTLVVDNIKNIENVNETVKKLGFNFNSHYYNDDGITALPLFTCIVICLISYLVLYNFIKKKIKYNANKYGILKACGYPNKEILKIEYLENIIISLPSMFFSFIIATIIYKIVIFNNYFLYFIANGEISVIIPKEVYLIVYVIAFIILTIVTIITMKIYLNKSIENLLKEG